MTSFQTDEIGDLTERGVIKQAPPAKAPIRRVSSDYEVLSAAEHQADGSRDPYLQIKPVDSPVNKPESVMYAVACTEGIGKWAPLASTRIDDCTASCLDFAVPNTAPSWILVFTTDGSAGDPLLRPNAPYWAEVGEHPVGFGGQPTQLPEV